METTQSKERNNPIAKMGNVLLQFSMKYMPDASIFAIILTFLTFLAGILFTDQGPKEMLLNWYQGFWELLAFAMQMTLIVVTGSAVAGSPPVKRIIKRIAAIPQNGRQAVWLVTTVSIAVSFVHWGLSLIVGALLAKEVARCLWQRQIPFEYGLLAAGGYVGQMTWQGLLSSSIGLSIASPGHILEGEMGVIPMAAYMGNGMNLFVTVALLLLPPVFAMLMHPSGSNVSPLDMEAIQKISEVERPVAGRPENPTVGERLNFSPFLSGAIGLMGAIYIIYAFVTKGMSALDINFVNFIFFILGILLHGNIANYIRAVADAVSGATGIIFQFPLYAGIQGMIKYSGLVTILSSAIVSISSPATFYFWTLLSAGIINMFVPSGGGQWTVQGPIAIASAKMMGADVIKTSLMVGYGNTWTNMCQPFWAIALLGITGLKAKDIMGYSTAIMFCGGLIFIIASFLPM